MTEGVIKKKNKSHRLREAHTTRQREYTETEPHRGKKKKREVGRRWESDTQEDRRDRDLQQRTLPAMSPN